MKTEGELKIQVKGSLSLVPVPLTMTYPRKCVADRRDKLTDGVNQTRNHNQERRAGAEDHRAVANLKPCPKPMVSLAPPCLQCTSIIFASSGKTEKPLFPCGVVGGGGTLPHAQPFDEWLNSQPQKVDRRSIPPPWPQ